MWKRIFFDFFCKKIGANINLSYICTHKKEEKFLLKADVV